MKQIKQQFETSFTCLFVASILIGIPAISHAFDMEEYERTRREKLEDNSSAERLDKLSDHDIKPLRNQPFIDPHKILGLTTVGMRTRVTKSYLFRVKPGLIEAKGVSVLWDDPRQNFPYLQKDLQGAALIWGDDFKCYFNLSQPELNKPCNVPSEQIAHIATQFERISPPIKKPLIVNFVQIIGNTVFSEDKGVAHFVRSRKAYNAAQPARDAIERKQREEQEKRQRTGGGRCTGDPFSGGCGMRNPWIR